MVWPTQAKEQGAKTGAVRGPPAVGEVLGKDGARRVFHFTQSEVEAVKAKEAPPAVPEGRAEDHMDESNTKRQKRQGGDVSTGRPPNDAAAQDATGDAPTPNNKKKRSAKSPPAKRQDTLIVPTATRGCQ